MKFMSLFLGTFIFLFSAAFAKSSQPLLSYNWGNKIQNSHLTLYIDGTIDHSEWDNFKKSAIEEKKLSPTDLEYIKAVIDEVSRAETLRRPVETSFGARSGTIDILVEGEMKSIDGIIRSGVSARELKSKSPALMTIKEFLKSYVSQIHI